MRRKTIRPIQDEVNEKIYTIYSAIERNCEFKKMENRLEMLKSCIHPHMETDSRLCHCGYCPPLKKEIIDLFS